MFECGIARGKLDERGRQETKIKGLALGLPLSKIVGPFAQFQNCPFEVPAITKLVMELVAQIPNAEPDREAIEMQTNQFFEKAKQLVAGMGDVDAGEDKATVDDTSVAKLFEEVKVMFQDLPSRVKDRISDTVGPFGRRRGRRLHPMMLEEMMEMGGGDSDDPIGILLAASMVREEMPWFYEIAREAYHATKSGDAEAAERQIKRLHNLRNMMMHGPLIEEFGNKDMHIFMMEFPRMFEHMIHRYAENKKAMAQSKRQKPKSESPA